MCTAITYTGKHHYFGRNLDLEHRYCETVTITPRYFQLNYKTVCSDNEHYAMIGMASVVEEYPLYYEATNEHGLSMAGLNFPGNAIYLPSKDNSVNIAPFEFIPWVLSQCKTVSNAKQILSSVNLINIPFSNTLPLSPLHWMISDKNDSIVVEPTEKGIKVYDNTVGVLTNNPPFDFHIQNLNNYLNLTRDEPSNRFADKLNLIPYSRGMGAMGLPGDLSSTSRFVRAVFTKFNSVYCDTEADSISQFFHILGSVAQQKGCVRVNDSFEQTIYSSCCNTDQCIYYYKTYENSQITGIHLFHENLDSRKLLKFPFSTQQQIHFQN